MVQALPPALASVMTLAPPSGAPIGCWLFGVGWCPDLRGFFWENNVKGTLPETNTLHLKIGNSKRKRSYSNHPFAGAMLVSGRVVGTIYNHPIGSI